MMQCFHGRKAIHNSQFEVLSKQEVGQKIRENIGDSRNQDTIDSFIQRSKKIMMQCFHGRKAMQDTTRPRWLKWTTYHLIVYVVMSDFNVSLVASTDYERPMEPFFQRYPKIRFEVFSGLLAPIFAL